MLVSTELKTLCCKVQIKCNRLEVYSAGEIPAGIRIMIRFAHILGLLLLGLLLEGGVWWYATLG